MGTARYDAIVVGGGPAGSTAGALLARQGHRVLLLEKATFPRPHIGESLIPGCLRAFDALGVRDAVERAGFVVKRGVTFIWGQDRKPWSIDFSQQIDGVNDYAFHVDRAEFDTLLLRHAETSGVEIREGCSVHEIRTGACPQVTFDGGVATAPYVVDASGQNALLARRLKLREFDAALNNVAIWRYFRGCTRLPAPRDGDIAAVKEGQGWWWYIPLEKEPDGRMSVGWVVGADTLKQRTGSLKSLYESRRRAVPELAEWMRGATACSEVESTRDWSYRSREVAGEGFLLAGDAAGFIDPILSSGCYLALTAGYLAALCINTSLRHPHLHRAAWSYYTRSYTRVIDEIHEMVHVFNDASLHEHDYFEKARGILQAPPGGDPRAYFARLITGRSGVDSTGVVPQELMRRTSGQRSLPFGVPENTTERRVLGPVALADLPEGITGPHSLVEQDMCLRLEAELAETTELKRLDPARLPARSLTVVFEDAERRLPAVELQLVPAEADKSAYRKVGPYALSYIMRDEFDPLAEPAARRLIARFARTTELAVRYGVPLVDLHEKLHEKPLCPGWTLVEAEYVS